MTLPVVVGVRTSAPSAASFTLIGKSSRMSSPSRVKWRCGRTAICTSASPGGPSPGLGAPLARRLGWRPEFPWQRLVDWAAKHGGITLAERRPMPPMGHFSLIRYVKS